MEKGDKMETYKSKDGFIPVYEVADALEKLLYNLTASMLCKEYEEYNEYFKIPLEITKKWISYFVNDKNLLKMTDEEVIEARNNLDNVPFDAYSNEDFYEEITIWFDVVVYFGSCPIGKKFDKDLISRKGEAKFNER